MAPGQLVGSERTAAMAVGDGSGVGRGVCGGVMGCGVVGCGRVSRRVLGRRSGVGGLGADRAGDQQDQDADQQSHRYEEPFHPTTAVNRQHTASG